MAEEKPLSIQTQDALIALIKQEAEKLIGRSATPATIKTLAEAYSIAAYPRRPAT